MSLERDIFPELTTQAELFGIVSYDSFVQIKSASSAVSASEIYLKNARTLKSVDLESGVWFRISSVETTVMSVYNGTIYMYKDNLDKT